MEQYMDDNKKLANETLRELRAAKERYTKDGTKCPVELDHRIKMYAGGLVKEPRDFDSEIRHITTALIIEENDYKYDPAIGKFVNGRDETALMKDAVKENDLNDKKRKELGYKIPEYHKKDRLAAVNIALGRPPEFVETPPEPKPFTPRPVEVDPRSVDEIIKERRQIKNNTTGLAALINKKII
jgi:hypothetical protein